MLKIINLYKTYISKKGNNQVALNNINLDFHEKGFVFIVGKSGSGKSTLLNLIGGLDEPTNGEIKINGQSTKSFTRKEFDYYRNTYIGFVFQEFNIIDNLTVFENVALPLELQEKNNEFINDKVSNVLNNLGIGEYANRKTNEISGGQVQRVAVARAIIKEPDIILADEPTGNLDSETSLDVLKLLKGLSKEKLVLMVTHDKEFAEMYGDRIIELKDGEVINDYVSSNSDTIYDEILVEDTIKAVTVEKSPTKERTYLNEDFALKKTKFPNIDALKMAYTNLINHKVRFLFTLLLFATTLVLFGVTALISNYDSNYSTSKSFDKSNISHYDLQYCSGELDLGRILACQGHSKIYDDSLLDDLRTVEGIDLYPKVDFSLKVIPSTYTLEPGIGIITNEYIPSFIYEPSYFNGLVAVKDDNHFTLIDGKWPDSPFEVVITDFVAEYLINNPIYKDKYINLNIPTDIIGKKVLVNDSDLDFTISGIVDTDYEIYSDLFDIEIGSILSKEETRQLNEFSFRRDSEYTSFIVSEEKFSNPYESYIAGYINDSTYKDKIVFKNYDQLIKHYSATNIFPNNIDINQLKDTEAVIYASDLLKVFNEGDLSIGDVKEDISLLLKYLNHTIEITPHQSSKSSLNEKVEFTIVGILNDTNLPDFYRNVFNRDINFAVNQKFMDKLTINTRYYNGLVAYYHGSIEANSEFLQVASEHNFIHNTEPSILLYTYEKTSNQLLPLLISVSIALGIFTIILINAFISFSITTKKREIGTLRALGAKAKDVSKIFIFEGLILGTLSALLGILIVGYGSNITNSVLSRDFRLTIYLYNIGLFEVLLIFVLSITIVLLSSFFTTKLITNKQPIDAIREK